MSTIKVDRIEPKDGLQSNAMGGIVQVVRVVHTNTVSTNSTTYVSTGLQASIKPRSASNKIMVSFEHSAYHTQNSTADPYVIHGIRIKRGTQVIYTPLTSTTQGPVEFGMYDSNTNHYNAVYNRPRVEYLDSPATTDTITYSTEIAIYDNDGIVYVNGTDSSGQSWMTLMEITA